MCCQNIFFTKSGRTVARYCDSFPGTIGTHARIYLFIEVFLRLVRSIEIYVDFARMYISLSLSIETIQLLRAF